MNRQTVIDAFKEAGLNDHQAEQVGYLYKQMGILKYDAHGGYALKHGAYFDHDTIRKAAANPLFTRFSNW